MRKIPVWVGLTPALLASSAGASPRWVGFDDGTAAARGTTVELRASSSPAAIELVVRIEGFWQETVPTAAGELVRIDLTGGAGTGAVGTPRLPVLRRRVAVPYGGAIKLLTAREDPVTIDLAHPLWPAQPAHRKCDPPPAFAFHPKAYERPVAPGPGARILSEQIMRGVRHVLVEIQPATYDPTAATLTLYRTVRLSVRTAAPALAQTRAVWRRALPGLWRTVAADLLGMGVVLDTKAGAQPDVPIHYLVVLPDLSEPAFGPALQPLIDWKREKGFVVTLLRTSEIGATKEEIKAALRQRYENPAPETGAPAFVILVGDVQHIPFWRGTGDGGDQAADQYYATMDAPDDDYTADQVPDFHIGRLSVANAGELAVVVHKTLAFEIPASAGADWYGNSLWVASDDHDALARLTHEWVAPGFTAAGMTVTNAFKDQIGEDQALQLTQNAITAGQSIINYSGHGYHQGWDCVPVDGAYVAALPDTGAYPFVITNACQCGQFQINSQGDCFSETWLKAEGGAVASWAASNNSLWDEDDLIEKAVWAAFLPALRARDDDPRMAGYPWPAARAFTTIGAITDLGLLVFSERADASWSVQYAVEEYNVLGDPSVQLWSANPQAVTLTTPAAVFLGQPALTIEVAVSGAPIVEALVAISKEEELATAGYTDAAGVVALSLAGLTTPGHLHLVVTGYNLNPEIVDLPVIPPAGAYVGILTRTWDDSGVPPTIGNNNDRPSPGEVLALVVNVKNFGNEAATDVAATLTTGDACVTVTAPIVAYGLVVPGSESSGTSPFLVAINDCDNNHRVDFGITITSDQDTWEEVLSFVVGNAVAGSVVVDRDGGPLPGAEIGFTGPLAGSALVAADGTFVLQGLDPGDYQLTASHTDYLSEAGAVTVPSPGPVVFRLGRPEIAVTPASLEVEVSLEDPPPQISLAVDNYGDRDLTFDVLTRYDGGNDVFGYRWADSDDGEVTLEWRAIPVEARHHLDLGDDDDIGIALPTPFGFYGDPQTNIRVGANGYLNFGGRDPGVPWGGGNLPDDDLPAGLLAVFYRDLDPSSGGEIYWGFDGEDFVVTWENVPEYEWGGVGALHTFQCVLAPTGEIRFNYLAATGGGPIVGLQNLDFSSGMNVGNGLHDDLTIAIATAIPFVEIINGQGVVAPGESTMVGVGFDTGLMQPRDYAINLRVLSNDVHDATVLVPLLIHAVNPSSGVCDHLTCVDDNPCTDDDCAPATGCVFVPNDDPCDDGDACTTGDTCMFGRCLGVPVACEDGNPCTADRCDLNGECTHAPNAVTCNDGNPCTINVCQEGACAVVEEIAGCCPPWDTSCCTSHARQVCDSGSAVWLDSCGSVEEIAEDCGERGCLENGCCPSATKLQQGTCVASGELGGGGCTCSPNGRPGQPSSLWFGLGLLARRAMRHRERSRRCRSRK